MTGENEVIRLALDATAVPSEPVGAGRYTIEIARALAGRSDIVTTCFSRRADATRWERLHEMHPGALEVAARAPRSRPMRLVYAEFGLGRDVDYFAPRFDLFHGPHYQMPRSLHLPAVVTIHDLTFVEHPEWHERSKVLLFTRAMRESARRARVIICVSEHTARRFIEHFDPRAEVRVITHGVDHVRFHPMRDADADEAVCNQLGIRAPFLVHVGTIEPRKNIPNLIRAFDIVGDRHRELRLVLAGQLAWGAHELERAIASSRHADRIDRLGYIADDFVAPLLRSAVAVAYPSIEEGFGLPALEALSCGAPLVTTSGSVMAEFAGDAALTVAPDAIDALCEALFEIIEGGARVDERRRAGITRSAAFTWERSAGLHLEAYRLALGR